MPLSGTQTHTSLWRDEGGTSMRALGYFIGAFAVALILGIGSAWYMIEQGSLLTTTRIGPWKSWLSEGNPNADPYTRAHLARSGRLPLTSTAARYFAADTDSSGRSLERVVRIHRLGRCLERTLVVDRTLRLLRLTDPKSVAAL